MPELNSLNSGFCLQGLIEVLGLKSKSTAWASFMKRVAVLWDFVLCLSPDGLVLGIMA